MPEEKKTTAVEVELAGPHLRIDARPAQLVAQLRGGDGGPVVTARPIGGPTRTESVPTGARQVTFRVSDELSVEATRGADFVALAGEGGRRLVVAFTGEVTVLPAGGAGGRFALAAHEAFLIGDDGLAPKVVPVAGLSAGEQAEITSVVEEAAAALLVPAAGAAGVAAGTAGGAAGVAAGTAEVAAGAPPATPPTTPAPVAPVAEPATPRPPAKNAPAPAKAASGAKKGKKGKGRPQPAKKAAPLVPAAAAAAGGAAKASGPAKKAAAAAPAKKAAAGGGGKGTPAPPPTGGGGGGSDDESYEETPGDRRVLVVTMVLGLLGALVLSVFLLTGESGGPAGTAAPTTTAHQAVTTTAAAVTTTAPGPSTTRAPTTTAPATTTSAAPAPAAKYDIEPKSCVQSGSSITYTAAITNNSTVPFDYTIGVVFKDAGGATIATATATVSRLSPAKATDFTTTASGSGTPSSCDVGSVEARPSR